MTKYADRANFLVYYDCPHTGRRVTRSTGTPDEDEAYKFGCKWEAELKAGAYKPVAKMDWADFRRKYESEVAPSLALKTRNMIGTVFNAVERIARPKKLRDLTASRLSTFQATLRQEDKSEQTLKTYLAHLLSALNWAVEIGFLSEAPTVKMPKRAKGVRRARARAVTAEECERMIAATEALTGAAAASSWRRLLEGLWLSGLRIGEAVNLYWDRADKICVDLTGEMPMLQIPAGCEKGNQDRSLPMTPDFAEFLLRTPQAERRGRVFPLRAWNRNRACTHTDTVGKNIARIGKRANVKVKDEGGKVKFASAHDFRRAFGVRWSRIVKPIDLQLLMRHDDIKTTLEYYVGEDAQASAKAIWKAFDNASINSLFNSASTVPEQQSKDADNHPTLQGGETQKAQSAS